MGVSAFTNSVCLDFVKRNTGTVICMKMQVIWSHYLITKWTSHKILIILCDCQSNLDTGAWLLCWKISWPEIQRVKVWILIWPSLFLPSYCIWCVTNLLNWHVNSCNWKEPGNVDLWGQILFMEKIVMVKHF